MVFAVGRNGQVAQAGQVEIVLRYDVVITDRCRGQGGGRHQQDEDGRKK